MKVTKIYIRVKLNEEFKVGTSVKPQNKIVSITTFYKHTIPNEY